MKNKERSNGRLIDADDLTEMVKQISKDAGFYRPLYEGFLGIIEKAATVEAADVVFCCNCEQFGNKTKLDIGMCARFRNVMRGCDFCSYGTRRTDHEL